MNRKAAGWVVVGVLAGGLASGTWALAATAGSAGEKPALQTVVETVTAEPTPSVSTTAPVVVASPSIAASVTPPPSVPVVIETSQAPATAPAPTAGDDGVTRPPTNVQPSLPPAPAVPDSPLPDGAGPGVPAPLPNGS